KRAERRRPFPGLTHKFLPLNIFPHPNILILCTHFTTADLKFIGNSSKFVELILRSLRSHILRRAKKIRYIKIENANPLPDVLIRLFDLTYIPARRKTLYTEKR